MYEIKNVLDKLTRFKPANEGTYNFSTHCSVEYSSGYQVSFVRPEAFEQLTHEEWDKLTLFYCNYTHSDAHIGVYGGSPEISFHCMDFSKAECMMFEFNQESVFSWKNKAAYPDDADFTRWFIMNPKYDENTVVNYHEILERVQ